MADNENKTPDNEGENVNEKKKGRSFMDVYRDVNEKERSEALRRQSEEEAARAEKERKARNEYAEKLRQEKLELLKLKQGIITEDDIPKEEAEEKHYTVRQRIGNFLYHNRPYVIVGGAILIIIAFLAYDLLTRTQADVTLMFIANDDNIEFYDTMMGEALAPYCPDYNGDGEVVVTVFYASATVSEGTAAYADQSGQTKLVGEFQSGNTVIIFADDEAVEAIGAEEDVFVGLDEVFPGDENVDGYRYYLNGTTMAEDIGYSGFSDGLFAAFRRPHGGIGMDEEEFRENYDHAVELWTNYINGSVVNPDPS